MTVQSPAVDVLLSPADRRATLLADARSGLIEPRGNGPRHLSPIWFYDERGSNLFEAITELPEYYLTRAELGLLTAHAADIAVLAVPDTLVELGSGTSAKTRVLLDALTRSGLERYAPLDVSEETLRAAVATLAAAYPQLTVAGVVGDYHRHLGAALHGQRRMVAFLGSTLGNLRPAERARFLANLRALLREGDSLLLGVDLVKDPARLLAAYDDHAGVTAEFNRNALRVLNAELQADFDPAAFDHVARWQPGPCHIEMRLRARDHQRIHLGALGAELCLEAGEQILTEISAKFTPRGLADELAAAGFEAAATWTAPPGYQLVLAGPPAPKAVS